MIDNNKVKPSLNNLFDDLYHPNPNINRKACFDMARYWPEASIERLIIGLSEEDITLRRKSIKALGYFGGEAVGKVVKIFMTNQSLTSRISCLKVLVKIAASEQYRSLPEPLYDVIKVALKDDDPQMILVLISLLRQLEKKGLPFLIRTARDKNILRVKASVTALSEINEPSAKVCLRELYEDLSTDQLIRESIIRSCPDLYTTN